MPFPKVLIPKVNIIAWLVFELTWYNVTVQHISYTTMRTPPTPTHTLVAFVCEHVYVFT